MATAPSRVPRVDSTRAAKPEVGSPGVDPRPGPGARPPPSSLPSSQSSDESSRMMTVPKSLGSAVVTIALGFTSITPLPITVTLPSFGAEDPGTTRTAQPLPVAPDGGMVVGQVMAG